MRKLLAAALISITPMLATSAVSASSLTQDVQAESAGDGSYAATHARLQSFSASSLTFTALGGVTSSGSGTVIKDRIYGAVDPETGLLYGYNYTIDKSTSEAIQAQWAPGAAKPSLGTDLSNKVVSISGYTVGATKSRIMEICTARTVNGPANGGLQGGPRKCYKKTVTYKTATLYVTAMTVIKDSTCQESDKKKVDIPWALQGYSFRVTSCVAGSSVFVKGPAYDMSFDTLSPPTYPVANPLVSVQSVSYVVSANKKYKINVDAGRWSKASFTLPARFDVGVNASYDVLNDGKPAMNAPLGRFFR